MTNDGLVVFAPYYADCVGIFDPTTDLFRCVDVLSTISTQYKFNDATTAKNGLVVFAPGHANCVGIFDPANETFSCDPLPSALSSGSAKFIGAATASNGLVVFAPYRADCVGTVAMRASPPPPPSAPPMLCENTCRSRFGNDGQQYINNSLCQDGDDGAIGAQCDLGTDCADC
eukprot:scaffold80941_cov57-Phaeocystis_antarctica.AAC.1